MASGPSERPTEDPPLKAIPGTTVDCTTGVDTDGVPATVAEEGVVAGGPSENPPKSPIEAIPGTTVTVPQCVDADGVLGTVPAEEGVVASGPSENPPKSNVILNVRLNRDSILTQFCE